MRRQKRVAATLSSSPARASTIQIDAPAKDDMFPLTIVVHAPMNGISFHVSNFYQMSHYDCIFSYGRLL